MMENGDVEVILQRKNKMKINKLLFVGNLLLFQFLKWTQVGGL